MIPVKTKQTERCRTAHWDTEDQYETSVGLRCCKLSQQNYIVWTYGSNIDTWDCNALKMFRFILSCLFTWSVVEGVTTCEPGHEKMCLLSYANNKGADQPAHPRSLISAFVVRCLDSILSLESIADISRT